MSDEIDTRISPTLHPGIAGEIADYDDDTRPLLGATETAVSEAFNALKSIHDAKAGAAKNPTLNEWAQLIAVDSHATKLMDKVYAKWAHTTDVLNNNIAKLEKSTLRWSSAQRRRWHPRFGDTSQVSNWVRA